MPTAAKKRLTTDELQRQLQELQQRLVESESRLRSFLSLSDQTFCCLEFDLPVPTHLPAKEQAAMMLGARVADCNVAFAHLCGVLDPSELIGNRFVSLVNTTSETLVERARRFIRLGYRVDGVRNTETLHDGTTRHFVNTSRGEIRDGNVVRVWITGRDVTYQTLIEAAAEQGEVELHRTAEKLDSAFWILDWNRFKVLYSGPAIQQRWAISRERLLEDPLCWLESVHDHDRRRVRDAFLTQAAAGTFDETFRVNLPDGSLGWVRNRCFPLPNLSNAELRVVGLAQDVSESQRARKAFISLFKVSKEMLFVMDVHGSLQDVNCSMAQMLGYDPDELNGISLFDLLPGPEQSAGRKALSQLSSGKPAVEVKSRFIRKDGTFCIAEWNAAPAGDDHLIYAAARDISGELTDHDRHSRKNAALVQLDRLSPRERQVADLVVAGKANKVIARELGLSQRTVETHRANLLKKLRLSTTAELIRLSLQSAD